jgi:hypothetical protein
VIGTVELTGMLSSDPQRDAVARMIRSIEHAALGYGEDMARYVVSARIGDELAKYYTTEQLATALVRNGWTWEQVLRANT